MTYATTSTTSTTSISSSSSYNLPTPEVRLEAEKGERYMIHTMEKRSRGAVGPDVEIEVPFRVTAKDLSDEIIDKGVYLEMAMYRRSRGGSSDHGSGYTIPKSWINGKNLWNGKETRGGADMRYYHDDNESGLMTVDRINHLRVNSRNELMPAWEYLHHRLTVDAIFHRDITGEKASSLRTTSFSRAGSDNSGKFFTKGYSSAYAPTYVKFRWLMRNDDDTGFITGGFSSIVSIAEKHFPYIYQGKDELGFPFVSVSPQANHTLLSAMIQTRVP